MTTFLIASGFFVTWTLIALILARMSDRADHRRKVVRADVLSIRGHERLVDDLAPRRRARPGGVR